MQPLRGRSLGLGVVIAIVTMLAVILEGRARQPQMSTGMSQLRASSTVASTNNGPAAMSTPLGMSERASAALVVEGNRVGFFQFNANLQTRLDENPGMTRRESCEQAVEYFVRKNLLAHSRAMVNGSVAKPTVAAAISTYVAAMATEPAMATAFALEGTPDIDVLTWLSEAETADQAFRDSITRNFPTPSATEIASHVMLDEYPLPSVSIVRLDFKSEAQGTALWQDLMDYWKEAPAGSLGGKMIDSAKSDRSLKETVDAIEQYRINSDMSQLPDYVQHIITSDAGTDGPGMYRRDDGSGVIFLVLERDSEADYREQLLEASESRLRQSREDEAVAAWVEQRKRSASIQVNVNCATY